MKMIKSGTTERVVMVGDPIPLREKRVQSGQGTLYHYLTSSAQNPGVGYIHAASGGLILRINDHSAAGLDVDAAMQHLVAGSTITVGTQSATVVDPPIKNAAVWSVAVNAWPALTNGDYIVRVRL